MPRDGSCRGAFDYVASSMQGAITERRGLLIAKNRRPVLPVTRREQIFGRKSIATPGKHLSGVPDNERITG